MDYKKGFRMLLLQCETAEERKALIKRLKKQPAWKNDKKVLSELRLAIIEIKQETGF